MQGFKDFMAKEVVLPVFYKKKDLLIYAVGIGSSCHWKRAMSVAANRFL